MAPRARRRRSGWAPFVRGGRLWWGIESIRGSSFMSHRTAAHRRAARTVVIGSLVVGIAVASAASASADHEPVASLGRQCASYLPFSLEGSRMAAFHSGQCVLRAHKSRWGNPGAAVRREPRKCGSCHSLCVSDILAVKAATQRERPLAVSGSTSAPGHEET